MFGPIVHGSLWFAFRQEQAIRQGAEAVDALRVTHNGEVAIKRPHAMENGGLQPVGVLIFVHEDVIEPFVQESDERLVAKQMKPIEEEIVVIEHMPFLLCFGIRFEK